MRNLFHEFLASIIGLRVVLLTDYVALDSTVQKNVELKKGATGKIVGQAPGAMEMRAMVNIDGKDYPIRFEYLARTLI